METWKTWERSHPGRTWSTCFPSFFLIFQTLDSKNLEIWTKSAAFRTPLRPFLWRLVIGFYDRHFPPHGKNTPQAESEKTTHRSSEVGRQTIYSRETVLVVPDTNVSHPDLPGLAASLLQSTTT